MIEDIRRLKASMKNIQTKLHSIISLKRKYQPDHDDTDADNATSRSIKPDFDHETDTGTDTSSDSGNDREQSVSPELTDDDE